MQPEPGAPILVLGHGASGSAATMAPHVAGLRARGIDARAIDLPKGRAERAVPRFAALLAGDAAADEPPIAAGPRIAVAVNRPGAGIQAFNLDHGTITALTAGSLTVAEAGGSTVTLTTDTTTRVRKDGKKATLADLRSGNEVVVVSLVGGTGTPRANLVVVPPAAPTSTTP